MRHYPRTTLTASLMMLAIAGAAIAGSRDDACAACKSRDVYWSRFSEQIFRIAKWSLCRGLGCHADGQRVE